MLQVPLILEEALPLSRREGAQTRIRLVSQWVYFHGGHSVHGEADDGAGVDMVCWRADQYLEVTSQDEILLKKTKDNKSGCLQIENLSVSSKLPS